MITYKQQLEVISKAYLTVNDIQKLVPVGKSKAREIMRNVRAEMVENNAPIFNYHTLIAPTDRVLKYLGLSSALIKKESSVYGNN